MRMKFRALAYLPVLISLGFLTACSTKNSSSTGGTGALFVTTQGDSLITPYTIDLSTGKFTANGKAVFRVLDWGCAQAADDTDRNL